MDAFSRWFSFEDFLAYFFPGAVGSMGLYILLLLTPLRPQLSRVSVDVSIGVILLVWSYVFGVVLAGFTSLAIGLLRKLIQIAPRVPSFPFSDKQDLDVQQDWQEAYKSVFEVDDSVKVEWSKARFYLSRSLVENQMPFASQLIRRQISLRRVRENMMPCVFIWCLAGVCWGFKWFPIRWGIAFAVVSLILSALIAMALAASWRGNCEREAQEVCVAMLVGFHAGLFEKQDKKADPSKGG